jgi:hypothetical protein
MQPKKSGSSNKFVWWEKSVEYAFIAEMVRLDMFRWVAPIAGNQETALADAIANWNGKLLLIEFKRDIDSLKSEYEKYTVEKGTDAIIAAYLTAQGIMSKYDGITGHGLIYGEEKQNALLLRATPYWNNENPVAAFEWCDKSGVSLTDFEEYLVVLSGLRGAASNTSNGSSGSRSFVIGIGKNKQHFSLELEDYVNLRPALKLEMEINLKIRQVEELNLKLEQAKNLKLEDQSYEISPSPTTTYRL